MKLPTQQPKKQQGYALLVFVLVLLGLVSLSLSESLSKSVYQQAQEKRAENIKRLAKAKEALLSFSVNYLLEDNKNGDRLKRFGKLPCPDVSGGTNNNGNSDANCGSTGVNAIGYLPYKKLGLGLTLDASNECFWYVVSGNYKNSPSYQLTNWDSNGLLNVVDEAGNLLHGDTVTEKPIALIISPGKSIGQSRVPDADLSDCRANYDLSKYLEGGANIDYETDLPEDALAEWTFLQSPFNADLEGVTANDQIIAIYRNEYWDRVEAVNNDLIATRNDPAPAPQGAIKELTRKLAECLHSYMMEETNGVGSNGVYPATLYPNDYAESDDYVASNERYFYGLFPENITISSDIDGITFAQKANFVTDYCVNKNSLDVDLWQNWKSQFFLITASDFLPGQTNPLAGKCSNKKRCIGVISSVNTIGSLVIFAKEATIFQNRVIPVGSTDLTYWNAHMNGPNAKNRLYDGGDATNDYGITHNDYMMCIYTQAGTLEVNEC